MNEINWAMIGCGAVTEVKSGPGLYKSKHSNLIGVFNRTYERAVDYINRHSIEKVYRTVEELLDDSRIDAVYISTPPNSHKHYAMLCLEAGKIPYIEKPLAMTYDEALAIKELSEKLNRPVYVAFYRRGLEKFLKIKELLDQHILGDVKYVNVTQTQPVRPEELKKGTQPWRVKPEISGGGKFLDIGIHVLDCLMLYFGEIHSMIGFVDNKGGYYEAEDTVMTSFKFKNGVVGTGNWCFVADKNIDSVEIIGDKGRIVYAGMDVTEFVLIKEGVEKKYQFTAPSHVAMPYQQAIVNELLGKEKSFASFNHAINLTEMTTKLLKQYY